MTNTNQEQLYRWVKATERNPTDTKDKCLNIGGGYSIGYFDNVGMWRYDTHTIITETDLEYIEWLEPYTPPVEDGKLGGAVELQLIEYWRDRCLAAEVFIKESPCDPDITANQIDAYNKWQDLNKSYPPSQPSTPVQGGWVSVEDGLPKEGRDVLVTDGFACMVMIYRKKEFNNYGKIDWWYNEDVTHWQPLPSPPVNKQD